MGAVKLFLTSEVPGTQRVRHILSSFSPRRKSSNSTETLGNVFICNFLLYFFKGTVQQETLVSSDVIDMKFYRFD